MSTLVSVFIDDDTELRLAAISKELGRSVEDLAASSVSESALNFFRGSRNDPARPARFMTPAEILSPKFDGVVD
jgi:hypothetical protein